MSWNWPHYLVMITQVFVCLTILRGWYRDAGVSNGVLVAMAGVLAGVVFMGNWVLYEGGFWP